MGLFFFFFFQLSVVDGRGEVDGAAHEFCGHRRSNSGRVGYQSFSSSFFFQYFDNKRGDRMLRKGTRESSA